MGDTRTDSGTDDPTGAEIAAEAPATLAAKAAAPAARMTVLAVLAGAFIAFGSIAFLVVQAVPQLFGPAQLLSGLAFSSGLVMVMVTGAELFTGNTMMALPLVRGALPGGRLATAWTLVWVGNLVGALVVAALFVVAGGLDGVDGLVGAAAADTAKAKLAKSAATTFASGVLANMLVCLAVWMAIATRTVAGKVAAIVGPVTVFVAAGFEHSVANMALLPMGIAAGVPFDAAAVAANLAVSTLGNIVGGASLALLLAYGHDCIAAKDG